MGRECDVSVTSSRGDVVMTEFRVRKRSVLVSSKECMFLCFCQQKERVALEALYTSERYTMKTYSSLENISKCIIFTNSQNI